MCGDGRGGGRGRDFPLNRLLQQNLPPPSSRPWGLLAWLGLAGAGARGCQREPRAPRAAGCCALCRRRWIGWKPSGCSRDPTRGLAQPRSPDIHVPQPRAPRGLHPRACREPAPPCPRRGGGSDNAHSCPSVGTGESCPSSTGHHLGQGFRGPPGCLYKTDSWQCRRWV